VLVVKTRYKLRKGFCVPYETVMLMNKISQIALQIMSNVQLQH